MENGNFKIVIIPLSSVILCLQSNEKMRQIADDTIAFQTLKVQIFCSLWKEYFVS